VRLAGNFGLSYIAPTPAVAWSSENQTRKTSYISGGTAGAGTKCTEEWDLGGYIVQCMQHKGQAQRFMATDDIYGDFNLSYRQYDIFTGWNFDGKSEQPLATAFANVVVDFGKFRAADELNLTGALSITVSAIALGSVTALLI